MMPDLAVTRLASSTKARNFLLGGPSLGTSVSALRGTCAAYLGGQFDVAGWDLPGTTLEKPGALKPAFRKDVPSPAAIRRPDGG